MNNSQPLRVGIGGPVGSGKTALTLSLCRALRERYRLGVVTNDIYTEEDAQFLVRNHALAAERIIGDRRQPTKRAWRGSGVGSWKPCARRSENRHTRPGVLDMQPAPTRSASRPHLRGR